MSEEQLGPSSTPALVVHQTYPYQVALLQSLPPFRTDLTSLRRLGGLISYIWCSPCYSGTEGIDVSKKSLDLTLLALRW